MSEYTFSGMRIEYEPLDAPRGTAIVIHGLGGYKDQPHIVAIAQACQDAGFSTIRMDTRHALVGDGSAYADATATAAIEDLRTVIAWAREQAWFTEPLLLAGHSLGGLAVLEAARSEDVDLLVPVAPVVNGSRIAEFYGRELVEEWDRTGWQIQESSSLPGVMKRLRWKPFKEDIMRYDVLSYGSTLVMPTLIICGSEDRFLEQNRVLSEHIPNARLHVIEGAPHTYNDAAHIAELQDTIRAWIDAQST
ncbi:MAG: alpha/beta hydrolase [Candidatus Woesearchaeota archaeon]